MTSNPAPKTRTLTATITLAWTAPSFAAVKGIVHAPSAKPAMRSESRDALLSRPGMDRRPVAGPRFRSDEPYEQGGQAAFACSDQRDGSPKRQTLCRITGSFLATATCALPLPDRLAMACRQSFKTRGFLEPRQDHDSSLIHQSASVLRPASSTTQIALSSAKRPIQQSGSSMNLR